MENLQPFIAGWGAGIFSILIGHPMDTIKTNQQMGNIKLSSKTVTKQIIKKEGICGLYRGMLFPLLSSGSLNSVYFGMYEVSLNFFQSLRGNNQVLPTNSGWVQDLFYAGCLGGIMQSFITCPSELIKVKVQLENVEQHPKRISSFTKNSNYSLKNGVAYRTTVDIYKIYGIRGFYVGFVPTLWRDSLGGGIYILSYQYTRYYMYGDLNLNPGLLETMAGGGIAGFASWIPVIPFDTVKSRIQADNLHKPVYKGMVDCMIHLFKQNGYRGFFKGFFMITLRAVPVNVSIIYGYELLLWLF